MYLYMLEHDDAPLDEYGEVGGNGDCRYIGVFSSKENALSAMRTVQNKKGFSKHKNSFHIDKVKVGSMWWEEGFFTYDD